MQTRILGAVAGLGLMFFAVYLFGYWIANGVVEEKASRVSEVVISATKTWHILVGKVIGLGAIGLALLSGIAALGFVASLALGMELPQGTASIAAGVLLWFVLGYAFYSCLFAVAGSVVSRQEAIQYTQMPLLGVMGIGFFVAYSNLNSLGSPLIQALSFFPPFTPMLMLVRMATRDVTSIELIAAVAVMLAATVGTVWLANRVYRGSILNFGSRVKLFDAWRSGGAGSSQ